MWPGAPSTPKQERISPVQGPAGGFRSDVRLGQLLVNEVPDLEQRLGGQASELRDVAPLQAGERRGRM